MSKSKRYHSHSHYKKHKKKRTRRNHHHHNYRHEYNMTGGYDSVPLTTDNKAISPPSGEEKKTVFSVLGSVIGKGVDKALNLVGYEKSIPHHLNLHLQIRLLLVLQMPPKTYRMQPPRL